MSLGTLVRNRLGSLEVPAANLYRSAFINLDDLATTLLSLGPARRVLEVGCGDAALAHRLTARSPTSSYLGIDIAPAPGRLFLGDPDRARFRSMSTSQLIAEDPEPFDLVMIVDVLHHVPVPQRRQLIQDAASLAAPGAVLAIKDWERDAGAAHWLAYAADRYISGDRTVDFPSRRELRSAIATALPDWAPFLETRIPPLRNNVLYALRKDA
ncbi:class I SAM-dependent methyltransferase [Kitasatospora sp. NPDC101801]|uniref:class I SAM-dependent methyltransferase n=1 Tax=Kitasatospora sp. NPDC101801 TaxID=3364103 RepID=UPI0038054334